MLAGDGNQLQVIGFPTGSQARGAEPDWERNDAPFATAKRQLNEYFNGKRREFELDLAPAGTPFQLSVLDELQKIPYGETCSYRDIATAIGNPKAVR
ncbi:MAG: methylated-DNA--[protein]-cysteine S-methyltransferase, partial [Lysobacterales bacterium]